MAQPLRMSGMNSGLDTESIINALSANSKLKITKQERLLLKYKATQDAYRDVISKFQGLQKKYFDILNKNTNLKGSTMWSQFSSKTLVNGEEKKMSGVSIKTSINSIASSYNVKVKNTATQSKLKGTSLSSGAVLDTDRFSDGGSYGMTVTVGDETKNISFSGGATSDETIANINDALSDAFGESNTSAASGKGMVYVDDSGKLISRAGKGITVSGAATLEATASLDMSGVKAGNNSISVRVGNETVNLSFQTIENGYFDEIFDENGDVKEMLDEKQLEKYSLYQQVEKDYIEKQKFDEYEAWKSTATDEEKAALKDEAFEKAAAKQEETYLTKYLAKEYDAYRATEKEAGNEPASYDDWKAANYEAVEGNALNDGFKEYYKDYALDKDMWSGVSYNEYDSFKELKGTVTDESVKADMTADDLVNHYNETSLNNSIGAAVTESGVELDVAVENGKATITAKDKNGADVQVAVTAAQGSTNNFGAVEAKNTITQISNSSKLSDLGLAADANGKYNFTINGEKFSFDGETTVKDMMRNVNASAAGVKMSYSSLDNAFTITSTDYGINSKIDISDGGEGLLGTLGLTGGATYTQGTNLEVSINGMDLESNSNSIEADGTTFTFTGVAAGTEFDVEVSKNNSAIKDTIKSFVEDYNKLIEDVYKYYDEKPEAKYYFLADSDKEELGLSEKEEEKWEEKSKKGLLYHDSLISTVMTNLRTSLMGSVEAADGNMISLATLGITTAKDYKEHGKLELDEAALDAAIEEYGDDIGRLFSDSEDGIMVKFDKALEGAVGTTGDKGSLINKAGLASGSSSTDNDIYNQMKRITEKIKTLENRYENEQNRLWKKYSAMESMLATLNNQQSSFMSYFGGSM